MKNISSTIKKLFLFIFLLSLLGCNAPATAVPTTDPQVFASTVSAAKTEAVQSVDDKLTQAATLSELLTATHLPAQTMAVTTVPPTLTPKVIVITQGPTRTPTQGDYQCEITRLEPKAGVSLVKGVDFDLSVTVKNVGVEKWSKDNVDFKYISGAKFQKKVDAIDLPVDVASGDSIDLRIDMTANTDSGAQSATWAIVSSSTQFCSVIVRVNVQ